MRRAAATGSIAVAVLVTACGTGSSHPPAAPGRTTFPAGQVPTVQAQAAGPQVGTRAGALVLARQLLSRFGLPAGSRPYSARPLPQPLRRPWSSNAGTGFVGVHRLFTVPLTAPKAYQYLMANAPAGMRVFADGRTSSPAGPPVRGVAYQLGSLPAGTAYAGLAAEVIPGHRGRALLRADAEVVWYPARSVREHLDAGRFAQVTISARVVSPRLHTVRRVVKSPAVIARLATLLNSFPASPHLAKSCPAVLVTYRIAFAVTARAAPAAMATTGSCLVDSVTVRGEAQPALQDSAGELATAARRLLHLKAQL